MIANSYMFVHLSYEFVKLFKKDKFLNFPTFMSPVLFGNRDVRGMTS